MKHTENYLIVSLGSIGRRHLKNLRQLKPNAQIAVWRQHTTDLSCQPPEGADFQFTTSEEVLAFKPKVAIIAGPSSSHVSTAMLLAKAGTHLLIEKPIANSLSGVDELIAICNKYNLVLMVGYNLRFFPSLNETKHMVDEDVIGRVLYVHAEVGQYLPDWRPALDYRKGVTAQDSLGGGVLLELSHELDYIYWMFGMPDSVSAFGGHLSELELDVEDTVELLLEYHSPKCLINVHLDMIQRAPVRRCRIVGEKGTIIWDAITDHIDFYTVQEKNWQNLSQFALMDRNQMYIDELNHFFDCINGASKPLVSGENARDVIAIVEAAKLSMQNNSKIEMKQYAQ